MIEIEKELDLSDAERNKNFLEIFIKLEWNIKKSKNI